jgi:hypothetical protein
VHVHGDQVDLGDFSLGSVALESIQCVEFHRTGTPDAPRFQVQLGIPTGALLLLETRDRVLARAMAERLARNLDRSLRDFTGRELQIRKPDELDRPLDLDGDPAGDPDPSWGFGIEEGKTLVCVQWLDPWYSLAGGLVLVAMGLGALGQTIAAGSLLVAALGASRRKCRLRIGAGRVEVVRGFGPFLRRSGISTESLEEVAMETGRGEALLLISDEKILFMRRPRPQLLWLRQRILQALRQQQEID